MKNKNKEVEHRAFKKIENLRCFHPVLFSISVLCVVAYFLLPGSIRIFSIVLATPFTIIWLYFVLKGDMFVDSLVRVYKRNHWIPFALISISAVLLVLNYELPQYRDGFTAIALFVFFFAFRMPSTPGLRYKWAVWVGYALLAANLVFYA